MSRFEEPPANRTTYADKSVVITRIARSLPHDFRNSWEELDVSEVDTTIGSADHDGSIPLEVRPASLVRLLVENDHGRPTTVGDDSVWLGLNSSECDHNQ